MTTVCLRAFSFTTLITCLRLLLLLEACFVLGVHGLEDHDYPWTWVDWTDVASEFMTKEISPDIVKKPPQNPIKVHFPSQTVVDFGNTFVPIIIKYKPDHVTWRAKNDTYYTLIVTGPDCPSQPQPTKREWQHWIVVNIPGNDYKKGETLTEWVGVSGLYKEGKHRIVFLVFEQPGNSTIKFDEKKILDKSSCGDKRAKFKTKQFVKKYGLGDPFAGNFCWLEIGDRSPYFIYDDDDKNCPRTHLDKLNEMDAPEERFKHLKTTEEPKTKKADGTK